MGRIEAEEVKATINKFSLKVYRKSPYVVKNLSNC